MKKLFTLFSAAILFSCCGPVKQKPIMASNAVFKVDKIEPVNDTIKDLCKYSIVPDSSINVAGYTNYPLLPFKIIDSSGKYEVNQNLILIIQPDTSTDY